MLQKVRVKNKIQSDPRAGGLLEEIRQICGITSIEQLEIVKVYRFEGWEQQEAEQFTQTVLVDAVQEGYQFNHNNAPYTHTVVEIARKPGVMNTEVGSLFKAAHDLGGATLAAVDTSYEYHFYGNPTEQELDHILDTLLMNKTVDYIVRQEPATLSYDAPVGNIETLQLSTLSVAELEQLSQERHLYLTVQEMRTIQNYFRVLGREPFDAELETLAQTWSEHCCHKTFKAELEVDGQKKEPLFKRLQKAAQQYNQLVVSAFVDNAGCIKFYDGYTIAGKVETHNSPSALEPYGGAATGTGGVFRDIMGTGQGAKVIASTDMFCFAPPTLENTEVPPGCLHPRYLFKKVVEGVRDYGNRMGVPTNNGSVHFHKDFKAKPTVIVGGYGIIPEERCQKGVPQPQDRLYVIGGKTGRDGIHGATFSSGQMTATTVAAHASAVQIGNAIEEKRTADALLMCRDKNLIKAVTDCGAGGFSSAIGEMAQNSGAEIWLEKAPLKYQGLAPWEIWVSESQERMICAVAPEHAAEFETICKQYNVNATWIGTITTTKKLQVLYHGAVVCDLDMDFLHNGLPQQTLKATKSERVIAQDSIQGATDWQATFKKVMSHPNIASKESIVRQYDHTVQGTNVLPPFGGKHDDAPHDAVVLTPLLGKKYGLVIAHGMNPVLNKLDPYRGAKWAITEALANLVAVGGNPEEVGFIDNFIWPKPDEASLWDLDAALDACVEAMHAFKVPFISGKDSLSSTYQYSDGTLLKIPPVLCVSVFGRIADITKTITSDFKKTNSVVLLIGQPDYGKWGGSVFAEIQIGKTNVGTVPDVNFEIVAQTFKQLYQLIQDGKILSCHDMSEGGLAVAVAEMCFGGDCGVTLQVPEVVQAHDFLFNETAGCFVVEVTEQDYSSGIFKEITHQKIGHTTQDKIIELSDQFSISVDELKEAWKSTFLF